MEDILNGILSAAWLPPLTKRLSFPTAWRIATALEMIYTFLRIRTEPPLTRFMVAQLSTSHWYNPKAAREELGYDPKVGMKEGFRRLKESLAH